jgi:hypothetical protein
LTALVRRHSPRAAASKGLPWCIFLELSDAMIFFRAGLALGKTFTRWVLCQKGAVSEE